MKKKKTRKEKES